LEAEMEVMDLLQLDQLVFHPWIVQTPRDVPAFVGGEGSFLIDHTGRRYLDFSSQLVFTNLGHQHPRVVSAIKEQADRLCTLAPMWASDVRGEAAKMVVDVAPAGLGRVVRVDHAGVAPDLMAFAKGVNSGYVPLGGVLVGDAIYDTFVERPYPGGLTYAGHPSPVPRRSARSGRCTRRA